MHLMLEKVYNDVNYDKVITKRMISQTIISANKLNCDNGDIKKRC